MKLKIPILIICLLISGCASGENRIEMIETGSDLFKNGVISAKSLVYKFKDYNEKDLNRDLFSFIYFEGDTLCFSAKLSKKLDRDKAVVNAYFVNSENGTKFRAERIDINDDRVSGFSLIGSILESFNSENLQKKYPVDKYCCREIKFKVILEIEENGKKISSSKEDSFRIEYLKK